MLTMPQSHTELHIRPMQAQDAQALSELAARVWRAHYVPSIVTAEQIEHMLPWVASQQYFADTLKSPAHRVWVCLCGNTVAGYIVMHEQEEGWFMDKFYVDTDRQRSGLGRALFEYVEHALQPTMVQLRVNRKNFVAINFYFKHGFTIIATHEKDIGGGFVMDDFIMEKTYE
ncbi:MAG: N-acetyltransferase family protein [Alphaproteobacteria bacterium]